MIPSDELKRMAGFSGIHYGTLERDYCLGWMLYGISRERSLYHRILFKGGTALRKCYFRDYRFSQDLDYTCRKELPSEKLEPLIRNACRNASHMSGMEFRLAEFQKTREVRGEETFVAKIEYRGPSGPKTILPRIQMDLTYYEKIVLEPEDRIIRHFYSDSLRGARAWSYPVEEILAEKLRAILQERGRVPRPRDYYDLWQVLGQPRVDKEAIREAFTAKCKFKKVAFKGSAEFFEESLIEANRAAWKASIGKQVQNAPPFDQVVTELRPLVERILP